MRLAFTLLLAAAPLIAQPADLILRGGRVWTANPAQPWAEAVAVRGNRIAAVGTNAQIEALRGERTEVIEAAGRLVTPGFNDAHIHFLGGSLRLAEVDLTGACTLGAMQDGILDWAVKHPQAPWITGGGWEYTCFPDMRLPRREDLDAIVKDRPVFLRAYDGHTAWANSKALGMAGVTRETKFTGFGELVLDEKTGEPTGCLKESAMSLVSRLVPAVTRQQQMGALEQGLKLASSLGITSFQNASGSREEVALYEELLRQSKLTVRVAFALSAGRDAAACTRDADLKQRLRGPMVRVDAVKFMLDGVIESHTAAMLEPYSDGFTGTGQLAWETEAYKRAVAACDEAGFQIYTHAIGDRAVRTALDAYTQVKRGRARIEHIETIQPSDIPRFAKLGVIASMEPIHADPGTIEVWARAVGDRRLPHSFAWRELEQAGARLVFSSDWPASISVDPVRGIHNAVNRQTVGGKPPGGWLPQQRLSVETALRGYTIEAAYASFEEDIKGSLQVGKLADFVVLSQDLFRIPGEKIHETRVLTTVFDGKRIYQRADQAR